ncbi:MAG: hypothetical protein Q9225_001782 [Loekoesia sp. 1 TL-2023]
MAGKKVKQATTKRSSSNAANGQSSNDFGSSDSFALSPVTITPFSVDMFQQATPHNDDPNQPVTMRAVVHIRPESIWASLAKYRNFNIRDQTYSVHQYAIISRFQPLPKPLGPLDADIHVNCIARILEIRAFDPQNVYVRVYWLYQPQEIPGGRQSYHGNNELIATNHMEIVDALRVNQRIDVVHWKEDEQLKVPETGLYWRQTYHFLTKEVSTPKPHCTCHQPTNPERSTIQCTNPHCSILLHDHCIIDSALTKLHNQYDETQQSQTAAPQPPLSKKQTSKINTEHYKVQVIDSQRPHHAGRKRLLFTDLWENRLWETDIECLKCGTRIR